MLWRACSDDEVVPHEYAVETGISRIITLLLALLSALGLVVAVELLLDNAADVLFAVLLERVDLPDVGDDVSDLVGLADLDADAVAADGEDDLEELGGGVLDAGEELGGREAGGGGERPGGPDAVLEVVPQLPLLLVAALQPVHCLLVPPHLARRPSAAQRPAVPDLRLEGALPELLLHALLLALPPQLLALAVLVAAVEARDQALLLLGREALAGVVAGLRARGRHCAELAAPGRQLPAAAAAGQPGPALPALEGLLEGVADGGVVEVAGPFEAAAGGGVLLLEVGDVLLVALVLRFYYADIADRLAPALFRRVVLRESVPRLHQLLDALLLAVGRADGLSPGGLVVGEGEDELFELAHLEALLLDDRPQEVDESALQQLLVAAPPARRPPLPLHDPHDVFHALQHPHRPQPAQQGDARLQRHWLLVREVEEGAQDGPASEDRGVGRALLGPLALHELSVQFLAEGHLNLRFNDYIISRGEG